MKDNWAQKLVCTTRDISLRDKIRDSVLQEIELVEDITDSERESIKQIFEYGYIAAMNECYAILKEAAAGRNK